MNSVFGFGLTSAGKGLIDDAEEPQKRDWDGCRKPADTPLPWRFVNLVGRCPNRKLTRPGRSDGAGPRTIATTWPREFSIWTSSNKIDKTPRERCVRWLAASVPVPLLWLFRVIDQALSSRSQ